MLLVPSLDCHTLLLEFNMHCPTGVEFVISKLVANPVSLDMAKLYFNNIYFKIGISCTG